MKMTLEQYLKMVTANANSNKWFNSTEEVEINGEAYSVGCKAFGLWCQVIQINGFKDSVGECKTQKAFKSALESVILSLANASK
jgi:hypothetical protein